MSNKVKSDTLLGLTNSEQKILLLSILCTDESNKLDFDKLAQYGGYKNPASASTTFRNAKRKLSDYKPEPLTSAEASAANTPKRGRPPKKAAAAETLMAADSEPAEEEAAPAPKAKRPRTTKKGIAQVIKKDSEDVIKSDPSPSKAKPTGSIKSEDSTIEEECSGKEEGSIKEEVEAIKQEPEGVYDECKTEDETPMTNEELDAQLDAMYEAGIKTETEGGA
ncbi:hypothetical protein BDV32DRAFT_36411 [Aspergillus pseudonomiae]|uniref:Uncharacterized protein n=1 Tax=Aspergillus pseudonomiae TaxID=1506151 RepID=A0A5N7DCT1_9EURO|nr:uncharacterized protein BDV37DRAFT_117355 [Aspergillus pseudonomiae]KAB8265873.1 hypothetical protein BDV32DRAFT_36411 [Aspergillus pseudonomiae]KAE8404276.1 hypothetical protein BDV37DRAFT_117355 [Aspergillus pseudonomiae]